MSQVFILFQSPCHKLPDIHTYSISFSKLATFSYFFSLLVKICQIFILFYLHFKIGQICILFQSRQNLPDCHTFSNLLKIWHISMGKLCTIEEISESYFKMSSSLGAGASSGGPEGRSCESL